MVWRPEAGGNDYPGYNDVDDSGGGGGSGYVYTSSASKVTGNLLTSAYYLNDTALKGGDVTFKSPTNVDESGHSGNGYARMKIIP